MNLLIKIKIMWAVVFKRILHWLSQIKNTFTGMQAQRAFQIKLVFNA
jgi:hypothetical protein